MGEQFAAGDMLAVMVRVLSVIAIALPVLGAGYILTRVGRQVVTGTWRSDRGPARTASRRGRGRGRDHRRPRLGVVAAARYVPADPGVRTRDAAGRGSDSTGETRSGRAARRRHSAHDLAQGSALPTADSPELALLLLPRPRAGDPVPTWALPVDHPVEPGAGANQTPAVKTGTGDPAPTWVFPFKRPAAPRAGDNQALAVNTQDGSTVYDVAFALVWANGDRVVNTNEAYAFASCTGCRTVAVAFQIVLVLGQANLVVPQNLAGAVNYSCVECVTYALATQLVVTLPGPLSEQSTTNLNALWEEIRAFGESIESVPVSELRSRLADYEQRSLDIIRADRSTAPPGGAGVPAEDLSGSPTTTAGTTSSTGRSSSTEVPASQPTSATSSTSFSTSSTSTSTSSTSSTSTSSTSTTSPSSTTSP